MIRHQFVFSESDTCPFYLNAPFHLFVRFFQFGLLFLIVVIVLLCKAHVQRLGHLPETRLFAFFVFFFLSCCDIPSLGFRSRYDIQQFTWFDRVIKSRLLLRCCAIS